MNVNICKIKFDLRKKTLNYFYKNNLIKKVQLIVKKKRSKLIFKYILKHFHLDNFIDIFITIQIDVSLVILHQYGYQIRYLYLYLDKK